MKALIVGLGSIGRRHALNLRRLDPHLRLIAWRHHKTGGEMDPSLIDSVVYNLEEVLAERPGFVVIANPPALHISTAISLAQAGIPLFIEKPFSSDLEGIDELIEECARRHLALMVGYNFRFYQPLQMMKQAIEEGRIGRMLTCRAEAGQYLPDWRPGTDYRRSVSARRDLGGGVLLELSHEFDYVRWLAADVRSVSARAAKISDLEIDVEDTAEVTLEFENGALGHIHLNMTQRPAGRSCRIAGTEGTLIWDGMNHSVRVLSGASGVGTDLAPANPSLDRNAMYLAEMEHFLDCVRTGREPLVGAQEGRRTLELVLAAKESSREGKVVQLCNPTLPV